MKSSAIDVALENVPTRKLERKVKIAELKLLMLAAEHNLPFLIFEHLPQFIQSLPDPETMNIVKCSRTKATALINEKVGPFVKNSLASILKKTFFSLILDETTDISTSKCLALLTRYYCKEEEKTIDALFGLIELDKTTADAIFSAVTCYLQKYDIPLTNIIGFASDNASVMMGYLNGVKAKFENLVPNIFVMGCLSHSLHLCASKACCSLPNDVERLTRSIYNYFSHSAKRQHDFKEFQEFVEVEPHKLLRPCQTRWLSLNTVIKRIIEQWNALIVYFEKESLIENVYGAEEILNELNSIDNQLYFQFLKHILHIVTKMNLDFQSESPRIHVILPNVTMYFQMILKFYMKREVFQSEALDNINPGNNEHFRPLADVYLGCGFEEIVNEKGNKITDAQLMVVRLNCLNFYVSLCNEIKNRINFKNEKLIEITKVLDVTKIFSDDKPSIQKLGQMFSNIVKSTEVEDLILEWRLIGEFKTERTFCNIEDILNFLRKQRNRLGDEPFPTVVKLFEALLSLPHGSASAERVFSSLCIIKNKYRNNLNVSTVESLLLAKHLMKNSSCHQWEPSDDLIRFKNADM